VFSMIAPLLRPLFRYLMDAETRDDNLTEGLIERLQETVGGIQPHLITVDINEDSSKAVIDAIHRSEKVMLGDVLRDPSDRGKHLASVPLVVRSEEQFTVLPSSEYPLKINDQILFCGNQAAHILLESNLKNEYALHYVRNGYEEARGWIMQWFLKKRQQRSVDSK